MTNSTQKFSIRSLLVPVFLPSFLFTAGEASLIPILPTAAQKLGADLPTAGLITGLVMAGSLFFDVPAAGLVNRVGERRAMITASVIAALAILGALLADNLWILGASIFVAGSMAAVFGLARHGFMAEHVPFSHRARSLGLLGGTFRGGAFLGPILGSIAVFSLGIHGVYSLAILMCALSAAVLLFSKKDAKSDSDSSAKPSTLHISRRESKKLLTVGIGSAVLTAVRSARAVGLPLWGVYLGMHEGEISLFVGIAAAVDFALFFTSGQIMDRFGRRAAVVPTLLMMATTMALLTLATTPNLFLIVAIAMSIANAMGSGIVLTIGADLAPPDARNEFLASYRLLMDFGNAGAPLAIASITAVAGLPAAFLAMAGFSVLGAGIMWRYLPKFGIR